MKIYCLFVCPSIHPSIDFSQTKTCYITLDSCAISHRHVVKVDVSFFLVNFNVIYENKINKFMLNEWIHMHKHICHVYILRYVGWLVENTMVSGWICLIKTHKLCPKKRQFLFYLQKKTGLVYKYWTLCPLYILWYEYICFK